MRLSEITIAESILEAEKNLKKGTYAGIRFSKDTIAAVKNYIKENDIPNAVAGSKMHTTLLYSRNHLPDYKAAGEYDTPMVGKPTVFNVWDSQEDDDGNKSRCLVLEYECSDLDKRHKELMDEHDATYDFPNYKTHITLSYDIGDRDIKDLPKFTDDLEIVSEYGEDLNLNWAKDNAKSED